ncbi:MAG TPA: 30S ribosomal protein S20 [Candidatus Obscuribacterales bacterium]
MPNIKSAKKRVLITERNRMRNRSWRSAIRTVRNEVAETVKSASAKNAQEALKNAYKIIDKAVSKGVLHTNSAARKKSRLAKQVLGIQTAAPAKPQRKKQTKV